MVVGRKDKRVRSKSISWKREESFVLWDLGRRIASFPFPAGLFGLIFCSADSHAHDEILSANMAVFFLPEKAFLDQRTKREAVPSLLFLGRLRRSVSFCSRSQPSKLTNRDKKNCRYYAARSIQSASRKVERKAERDA